MISPAPQSFSSEWSLSAWQNRQQVCLSALVLCCGTHWQKTPTPQSWAPVQRAWGNTALRRLALGSREGVKWSDMSIISDSSMPAKGMIWARVPKYQVTQFAMRGIFKGVAESLPAVPARLTQLKGWVFFKQRWKREFYLGQILFQTEKLHKERTNIHFHERREEDWECSIVSPCKYNKPSQPKPQDCAPAGQAGTVFTPKGAQQHSKHL